MSWKIQYTSQAKSDLRDIYDYISGVLLVPETAKSITQKIMQGIRELNEMPFRCKLYHDEPWHGQGIRFFPIKNYLVFYLPVDQDKTVYIVRIMYGERDISKQLEETMD